MAHVKDLDAVILDLGLPDMNGFEVLEQIRTFSKVPVIVSTVRNSKDDRDMALNLGATDYLTKPFQVSEFALRLESVIEGK